MKKKAFVVLSGCLVMSMLAGCASNNAEAPKTAAQSPAAKKEDVTLKIYNSKSEIVEAFKKLKVDFESENSGIKLEVETSNGPNYELGLKAKFAGSEAPDIFANNGHIELDNWIDHLEDLSAEPWAKNVVEITKSGITKGGKLYGMPTSVEAIALAYNKDLFAKAGIAAPPKTMTELKAAIDKLNAAKITPFVTNFSTYFTPGVLLFSTAVAKQPDPMKFLEGLRTGNEKLQDNAVFKDWTSFVDLMLKNGQANPLTTDYNTQLNMMATGQAGMSLLGNFIQPAVDKINPNANLGLAPLPINDDANLNDRMFVSAPSYWVVNKDSKVKEEAKKFLNWLVTSEKGKKYITKEFNFIPALTNIEATPQDLGVLGGDALVYIKANKVLGVYSNDYATGTTKELGTVLQKFAGGKTSRDQLLPELQEAYKSMNK